MKREKELLCQLAKEKAARQSLVNREMKCRAMKEKVKKVKKAKKAEKAKKAKKEKKQKIAKKEIKEKKAKKTLTSAKTPSCSEAGKLSPPTCNEQMRVLSDCVTSLLRDMSAMNHQQYAIASESLSKSCALGQSLDAELLFLKKIMCSLKAERQRYDAKINGLKKELSHVKVNRLKARKEFLRKAMHAKLMAAKKKQSLDAIRPSPQVCALSEKCRAMLKKEQDKKERKCRAEKGRHLKALRDAKRKACLKARQRQLKALRKRVCASGQCCPCIKKE